MRGQQRKICNKESKKDFDEHEQCGCSQNTMGNLQISISKSGLLCSPERYGAKSCRIRGPERPRLNSTTTTDTQISHTSIVHWWIRARRNY